MLKLKLLAFIEFLQYYSSKIKESWAERKQFEPVSRRADEIEFLPAHLELVEKPVSAFPHWSARLIIAFLCLSICWAMVGKIDVVTVAQGKITATGRSKTIQPLETAIVKSIYVKDGEPVKQGQKLLELTAVGVETDQSQTADMLKTMNLSLLRLNALLESIEREIEPDFFYNQERFEIPSEYIEREKLLAANQYQAWQAQKNRLSALIEQKKEEKRTAQINITKHNDMLRYEKERTQDLFKLYRQKSASKHEYYQQFNKQLEVENVLEMQKNRLNEIEKEISQVSQELQSYLISFKRDLLNEIKVTSDNFIQTELEFEKANQRKEFMDIRSPIDGVVQQLQTYTVGGVVTAAQPLMVIAPSDYGLEVEAVISNQDIGFVKQGQEVVLKVSAFPYTRYGYISGKVETISLDAVEDENNQYGFATKISMDRDYLSIQQNKVYLKQGMLVSAEIKTEQRSVIDYFLSPLKTTIDESLRER